MILFSNVALEKRYYSKEKREIIKHPKELGIENLYFRKDKLKNLKLN